MICRSYIWRYALRKVFGSVALLAFLAVYIVVAVHLGEMLQGKKILSILFYCIAGIGWALPLKPLLQWMHAKDEVLPKNEIGE